MEGELTKTKKKGGNGVRDLLKGSQNISNCDEATLREGVSLGRSVGRSVPRSVRR